MKDFLTILRRNIVSPIVIAILTLATILFVLNEPRDGIFLSSVIILNTLIAIIQEFRARLALKKLELMTAPYARRLLSNGKTEDVMFNQVVIGDEITLQLGDEVPADGEILTSKDLEVDESIMTGESAPIEKPLGSVAYAASSVTSGSANMCVVAVGLDTKVGKMTSTLKKYKAVLTPLQRVIATSITWLTYGALGMAGLIFVVYSLSGQDAIIIFKTIAAGAVTIVPEGLLLASSLLLAYGSIRLAQVKVLPQKISAIEGMALLDILCTDKTGTLTSDEITFEKLELFDGSGDNISELISIVADETSSGSSTGEAMISGLAKPDKYKVLQTLSFSSERKMSGLKLNYLGKIRTIVVGAPEYVEKLASLSLAQKKQISLYTHQGKRVLLAATFSNTETSIKDLKDKTGTAVGIVVLANELRPGVEKTVDYLQRNSVSIRVISGDNPNTVQYVAEKAGILNYKNVISGAELKLVKKKDWDKVVSNMTIFARVLPEQKERLIATFRRLGNYTGMVGDGVNDALAIKKSDIGIAMYSGATATRRVADIVLLDNSFNSLPIGMRVGNRIIQAIEIIAMLFFHKIIFGAVLLLSTLALGLVYPFDPRHITFMGIFLVTMPTIMWTLFPPSPRHRVSPRHFWRDTLFAVSPIAILTGVTVTLTYAWLHRIYPNDPGGVSTITVVVATLFGIYLVFLVPRMFDVRNNSKAQIARILYTFAVIFVIVPSFGLHIARDFFNFSAPTSFNAWSMILVIVGVATLQWFIAGSAGKRLRNRES